MAIVAVDMSKGAIIRANARPSWAELELPAEPQILPEFVKEAWLESICRGVRRSRHETARIAEGLA